MNAVKLTDMVKLRSGAKWFILKKPGRPFVDKARDLPNPVLRFDKLEYPLHLE
jgi:hypothetical protein